MHTDAENDYDEPTGKHRKRPTPQQQRRRRWPAITIFVSFLALAVVLPFILSAGHVKDTSVLSSSFTLGGSVKSSEPLPVSYELAKKDSFGFFTDIDDKHWKRMQKASQREVLFRRPKSPEKDSEMGALWMLENVDPIFTCLHQRRIGGRGDGAKWVCDPHRLAEKEDCLIYSIGSAGQYQFEDGLISFLGKPHCEIHVFDPNRSYARNKDPEKKNIHYHNWGLRSSYRESPTFGNGYIFKSALDIVRDLGHEGRRIDIFKIDCEGCEWTTYKDWLNSKLDIRQILIETHISTHREDVPVNRFFREFVERGFLPFSKEANTHPNARPVGTLFEYGFVRLNPDFLGADYFTKSASKKR